MKLTIELNTGTELSERDRAILYALSAVELVSVDLNAAEDVKPCTAPSIDELLDGADPETGELNLAEEFEEQMNQAAGGGGGGSAAGAGGGGGADFFKKATDQISVATGVDVTGNGEAVSDIRERVNGEPEEIDAAGMPWDARINPKSRGKIKTGKRAGMWKYIKQLDAKHPGLIAQVEAENKARLIAQVHAPESEPTEFEVGENGQAVAAQVFGAPRQDAEQQQEDPQPDPEAFGKMLSKLTPRMIEKPEFAEKINDALAAHKINGLPDLLAKHPNLIPQIDQELDALWLTV